MLTLMFLWQIATLQSTHYGSYIAPDGAIYEGWIGEYKQGTETYTMYCGANQCYTVIL